MPSCSCVYRKCYFIPFPPLCCPSDSCYSTLEIWDCESSLPPLPAFPEVSTVNVAYSIIICNPGICRIYGNRGISPLSLSSPLLHLTSQKKVSLYIFMFANCYSVLKLVYSPCFHLPFSSFQIPSQL